MSYLAIARKWRPATFEDLVGQSHVVQTLQNAIRLDRVAHAYLFSGARGVGKTSVARIFAKALRCPNAKDGTFCNTCAECVSISESRSVDVVEIDGASNNGVESVRGIRENVVYGAATGRYKIYIIDEVHMLTLSAFNALLKTLEEPPPHVLFIFATTESQKIPLTILSRCQRFEFRRLTISQMAERLEQILKTEKISLSGEAIRLIATHADGSLRDATSLLDQVLSFLGGETSKTLGEADVVKALGISEVSHVTGLLNQILKKSLPAALSLIEDIYASGVDLKHFSERLLEEIRFVYLLVLAKETKQAVTCESLDISMTHFQELQTMAANTSLIQVERMAQITSKTIQQLGWASHPQFALEMAAVRMSKLDELSEFTEESLEIQTPAVTATPPAPVAKPVPVLVPTPTAPPSSQAPVSTGDRWKGFVDGVMKKRPLLGALLCHAGFHMEGKQITLAFPVGSFYERQAQDQKNRTDIEEMLKTFFGRETVLVLSTDTSKTSTSIEQVKQEEASQMKKKALEHPSVLKAQEILGAQVVGVNVEIV